MGKHNVVEFLEKKLESGGLAKDDAKPKKGQVRCVQRGLGRKNVFFSTNQNVIHKPRQKPKGFDVVAEKL